MVDGLELLVELLGPGWGARGRAVKVQDSLLSAWLACNHGFYRLLSPRSVSKPTLPNTPENQTLGVKLVATVHCRLLASRDGLSCEQNEQFCALLALLPLPLSPC
jgi:hypothetical protein